MKNEILKSGLMIPVPNTLLRKIKRHKPTGKLGQITSAPNTSGKMLDSILVRLRFKNGEEIPRARLCDLTDEGITEAELTEYRKGNLHLI